MICEHLRSLEQELLAASVRETYRGQAWTDNCREFVYFDCLLDREALRERLRLPDCVKDSDHLGTHSGEEYGFTCSVCLDGIMGLHPRGRGKSARVFG